jgi:hypothetical protein
MERRAEEREREVLRGERTGSMKLPRKEEVPLAEVLVAMVL